MSSQGNDVLKFIEEHNLSLIPEVFSVLYDALSDQHSFLKERLATIMEAGPLNDEIVKSLYKDYIFQKQLHASILAEEEVTKTLNLINRVHNRLEEATSALDSVQETLEQRKKIVSDIDTTNEIEMLKDTISHDISTLIFEINDSNLWIKHHHNSIKDQFKDLKAQQRVHYEDALTGLPNKFFLKQKIAALSSTTSTSYSESIFVGKLCVRNLDTLNQMHGRTIGDAVLRKLGGSIRDLIPDDWEVFRIKGNDFAVTAGIETPMRDVTMKLIALKKTFAGKKFRSKTNDQPVVIDISVETISLLRATAEDDVFEMLNI